MINPNAIEPRDAKSAMENAINARILLFNENTFTLFFLMVASIYVTIGSVGEAIIVVTLAMLPSTINSATTKNTDKAKNLIDSGFKYLCTTPENVMLFRKRK